MQKILYVFLALCLFHTAYSACADGSFATTPVVDAAKGNCTLCFPLCTTCTTVTACTTFIDRLKGVNRTTNTALCSGATITGSALGYNKNSDTCDRCADGCASCSIDYDVCIDCKSGWDFDRAGLTCTRATLGLAAVVLALSALTLIVVVITCICACKLWSSWNNHFIYSIPFSYLYHPSIF